MSSSARAILSLHRLVPVVTFEDPSTAAAVCRGLRDGGISLVEVALRTPASLQAVQAAAAVPGVTVAAGTVLTPEQVGEAAAAGAKIIVSPGIDESVIAHAASLGLPVVPGVATATEVQTALRFDLDVVKVFPAAMLGGADFLRALAGPFPGMAFLPSGGITPASAPGYLALPSVPAVSGSWMVPANLVAVGDEAGIRDLAKAAVTLVAA